jgi:murein DD-endopeptidase MepM/ murein hydrolase activator NlpD
MLRTVVRSIPVLLAFTVALSCSDSTSPDGTPEATVAQVPLSSWSVTQDFGAWNEGFQGYHLAEDVEAAARTEVHAMADGVVKAILTEPRVQGYGSVMMIEHKFGDEYVTSLYGHISTRMGTPVNRDDQVTKGQVIAFIAEDDEDGGGWAPHLHFGVRKGQFSDTETICSTWLYVGYTRECQGVSHQEHRNRWYDPSDFVMAHGGEVPQPEPN